MYNFTAILFLGIICGQQSFRNLPANRRKVGKRRAGQFHQYDDLSQI